MRPVGLFVVFAVLALASGGCAELRQMEQAAKGAIDALFDDDTDDKKAPPPPSAKQAPAAQDYYTAGLAAWQAGKYEDARGLFENAAKSGHVGGHFMLANMMSLGEGGTRDAKGAAGHWRSAAEQGHAAAQKRLAKAISNGEGVTRNGAEAARWYGIAAYGGDAAAQFAYGLFWASGHGLPKNADTALTWLTLARLNGHKRTAKAEVALKAKLSKDVAAAAAKAAGNFFPYRGVPRGSPATVIYVQHRLAQLGHKVGRVDGLMGPKTRGAIRKYRKQAGLGEPGGIDAKLLEHIRFRRNILH